MRIPSRPRLILVGLAATPALALGLVAAPPVAASPTASPVAAAPVGTKEGEERHRSISGHPLVIGHRGASGYRPEHTLEAYRLAIRLGADYIEPDLVSTKDGVLVARHENEISTTTDVAEHPEFAARKTTKTIDNVPLTGWFTEDFTYRELRTLRAKERIPEIRPQNTRYDGRFKIPTFQEVLDLAKRESRSTGRAVGVYPETKHPTYFDSIGLSLEEPLVRTLRRNGLARRNSPVFLQSFETQNLRDLDRMVRVPLIQLVNETGAPYDLIVRGDKRTYADLVAPAGLDEIARYADGIGPSKNLIVPRDMAGNLQKPTSLVRDAHREGLLVHPFTFRSENSFLPLDFRRGTEPTAYGNWAAEYELFFRLGVDGVFSDNPDDAVIAREGLHLRRAGAA